MAADLVLLRAFRDEYLMASAPGRSVIRSYYRNSPAVAGVLARSEGVRLVARQALRPVVWFAAFMLGTTGTHRALILGLCLVGATVATRRSVRRRGRRRG